MFLHHISGLGVGNRQIALHHTGNFVSEIVAETIKLLSKVVIVRQRRQMLRMQQAANCLEQGFWIASLVLDFVSSV